MMLMKRIIFNCTVREKKGNKSLISVFIFIQSHELKEIRNVLTAIMTATGPRKLQKKPLSILIQQLFGGRYSQKNINEQTWMNISELLKLNSLFASVAFRIHHSRHTHHNQTNHIANHTQESTAKYSPL